MARPEWINEQAWDIIQTAKAIALAEEAEEILLQHLFQGIAIKASNLVKASLAAIGLSENDVDKHIQGIKPHSEFPSDTSTAQRFMSAQAEAVIRNARALASEHPVGVSGQIAPIHLWVSICSVVSEFREWLLERGWSDDCIRKLPEVAKRQLPQKQAVRPALKQSELQVLNRFCSRNLTELARQGRLTPVYGVEEITEQIIRCLLRRDRRSIVLTGPAGVGKTKLVEDLALRIANGEIPELEGCHVFELDLALFTRGTHLAGSRAERWAQLTEVLRAHPEEVILFIDELHTIVGLPLEGQAMDLANALKPLLVETRVRIIGATTPEEYRRHIEGDPALARRFTEPMVLVYKGRGSWLN